jgi:hypothetical protein
MVKYGNSEVRQLQTLFLKISKTGMRRPLMLVEFGGKDER